MWKQPSLKAGSSNRKSHSVSRKRIQLAIFDLDGTLTKIESTWQYLHVKLGTWETGRISAEKYWRGEISYEEWAKKDSILWRDVSVEKVISILREIPYVEGATETFEELKRRGIFSGIVSAGISLLADRAKKELGADFAVANKLLSEEGKLTGEVRVKVSLRNKDEIIKEMAWMLGVDLENCAVIGDNVFDLPDVVGLKIAFNPKSRDVRGIADITVDSGDLRDVLEHLV